MAIDKNKALETALGQIEKQFGKGAVMRLGQDSALNVGHVSTGSLSLDIALGIGGLPRGRIIEIYGPESSGKTTVTLHFLFHKTFQPLFCKFFHNQLPEHIRILAKALQ